MSSRIAFGLALRLWRLAIGRKPNEVAAAHSYIAYLEKGEKSVSLEKAQELSADLGLHPLALIVTSYALEQGVELVDVMAELNVSLKRRTPSSTQLYEAREYEAATAAHKLRLLARGLRDWKSPNWPPEGRVVSEQSLVSVRTKAPRRVRAAMKYSNPHSGEVVIARTLANKTLQSWVAVYGAEVVRSWAVPFE